MKKIFKLILFFVILAVVLPLYSKDNIPDGYDNVKWGEYLSDVKPKIKGKLSYTDDKSVLLSTDLNGSLKRTYGFFYVDLKTLGENSDKEKNSNERDEGKFSYVVLHFPYLSLESVKKKLFDKYGKESKENIKDNRGVVVWESDKTVIMLSVDSYEAKPYCKRITYVSKNLIKDLEKYKFEMFNKVEIELIKNLQP